MLYDLVEYEKTIDKFYSLNDLTAVYAVRLGEDNPWVLDRLALIANYYVPLPKVIIVDFGSLTPYADMIREQCEISGFQYVRLDDDGVFSAAVARNHGFSHVKTPLVFFNDIDCFSTSDMFAKLISSANDQDLSHNFDKMINLAVYHFTEDASEKFFDNAGGGSGYIGRALNRAVYSERYKLVDFVAPYSNIFLMRSDFFDLTGGYNETFRGHGSEDFEYLIRQSLYSDRFPRPTELISDYYGPLRDSFYKFWKEYKGFRRLFEAISLESELAGLRVGHLWHPKNPDNSWVSNNDWKRNRFNEEAKKYLSNEVYLLECDWLPRSKKLLALVKHADHVHFMYPLRLSGYEIDFLDLQSNDSKSETIKKIEAGHYDAVAIFNPYMKSHSDIYTFYKYAVANGAKPVVIERGALPESWYYAEEMSYADSDFANFEPKRYSAKNKNLVEEYLQTLRLGNSTLEKNGNYEATWLKYKVVSVLKGKKCFLPLQLAEDVAITRFNDGKQPYLEYVEQIFNTALEHPDVLFFIKYHPLSHDAAPESVPPNVVVCAHDDNVHALIDLVDVTICYNSGVGLLSVLHEKKTIAVGNAYYVKPGLGIAAKDFSSAVNLAFAPDSDSAPPDAAAVNAFAGWLLEKKYSFYKSESIIRNFGHRKSHGYHGSRMYVLNYDGFSFAGGLSKISSSVSEVSYGGAKLMLSPGIHRTNQVPQAPTPQSAGKKKAAVPVKVAVNSTGAVKISPPIVNAPTQGAFKRKFRKFIRTPRKYFEDSKNPVIRPLRFLFKT